jgi:hypothetical protein
MWAVRVFCIFCLSIWACGADRTNSARRKSGTRHEHLRHQIVTVTVDIVRAEERERMMEAF